MRTPLSTSALLGLTLATATALAGPIRQQPLVAASLADSVVASNATASAQGHGHHKPPANMELFEFAISGPPSERVSLTFFSDGYTTDERDKFLADARSLTSDIVHDGPLVDVAHLVNVYGVFVPSKHSGLGQDKPLPGAPFGLYREGPELRAVYPGHAGVGKAACAYWKGQETEGKGGCDYPILLGNSELYGGLGGGFTIITASKLNGPLVFRHELGHSILPAGEEYDGGFVYDGCNSDTVENLHNLKWAEHLSDPSSLRVEPAHVPIQAYPWHDLEKNGKWSISFSASNVTGVPGTTGMLRTSVSSIPYASHLRIMLQGAEIDLSGAFLPGEWVGSRDRRWLEVPLPHGLPAADTDKGYELTVELTEEGRRAEAGQGGKMVTSMEILEYGAGTHFEEGFIGAWPTYSETGTVTLRPTNEGCVMRAVNYPRFCAVCAEQLKRSLEDKIAAKQGV